MKERKISIITPVFNGAEYIEKCILSIKNQNYSNFEHIIMDGGSTDGTEEIVKKHIGTYDVRYIRQKDNGMYDAICKGFDMATGEIFAWLNSDDSYMPWAFQVMNHAVSQGVHWGMGLRAIQNEYDVITKVKDLYMFRQKWGKKGYYGPVFEVIEQESTFWTKELWEKANGNAIAEYRLAGDWKLWCKFFEFAPLFSINTVFSSFRKHAGQLSSNFEKYRAEMNMPKVSFLKRRALFVKEKLYFSKLKFRLFMNRVGRMSGINDPAKYEEKIDKIYFEYNILKLPDTVGMAD